MPTLSHQQAQQRIDDIHAFNRELQRLAGDQVLQLDGDQHARLEAYQHALLHDYRSEYDIDQDARDHQLSLGMRIATLLGALALAASLFFLFYQFWGWLGTVAQVGLLLGASLLTLALTTWLRGRDGAGYYAKLMAMLAFACFVLNIFMLGQIFNITPSDRALLPWAAYALLLAYACDSRLLLGAALLCLLAFIAARVGSVSGLYWLSLGERPENFYPAALAIFALPLVVDQSRFDGFAATYRVIGLLALFLPTLALANWGTASYLGWPAHNVENLYQVLGFVGAALVIWLGVRREWNDTLNTGLAFFVVFLFTKFYDWWWESLPKYLFFLLLGLSAVLILVVLQRLRIAHGLLGETQP
ncbi:MAG: hypothetical protein GAK45_00076 [Pseudomonas citronellolis]|nr:MAG: hypothetical protein GAK45_00076 [Pseudomonas citronellolis]